MLGNLASGLFLVVIFGLLPVLSWRTHRSGEALAMPRVGLYLSASISQWLLLVALVVVLWLDDRRLTDVGLRVERTSLAGSPGEFLTMTVATLAVAFTVGIALWLARRLVGASESATTRHIIPRTARERWVFALVVSPTAGVVEELLYRGFAITLLAPAIGPWGAALLTSFAFSLGHVYQGPLGVLRSGTIGLVLAVPYVLTGSLIPSIIAHALIDVLSGSILGKMFLDADADPSGAAIVVEDAR